MPSNQINQITFFSLLISNYLICLLFTNPTKKSKYHNKHTKPTLDIWPLLSNMHLKSGQSKTFFWISNVWSWQQIRNFLGFSGGNIHLLCQNVKNLFSPKNLLMMFAYLSLVFWNLFLKKIVWYRPEILAVEKWFFKKL